MFCLVVLACIFLADVNGQILNDGHHHARPYQVGYYVRDPHRHQHAEEIRDHAGAVAGRYGYLDARGIGRQVHYVADHAGLRARVHTNEPAVVHNTPVVAAPIASGSVAAHGVALVPGYDSVLGSGYGYGLNGYGLRYGLNGYGLRYGLNGYGLRYGLNGYGLGYGYSGLGYGYGNYGDIYA